VSIEVTPQQIDAYRLERDTQRELAQQSRWSPRRSWRGIGERQLNKAGCDNLQPVTGGHGYKHKALLNHC